MKIGRRKLAGVGFSDVGTGRRLASVHPGAVLFREFIEPLGLTRYRVAKAMRIPQRRLDEMCSGKRAVTADTALRLARVFGMDAQAWLNLQAQHDLERATREVGAGIEREAGPLEGVGRAGLEPATKGL